MLSDQQVPISRQLIMSFIIIANNPPLIDQWNIYQLIGNNSMHIIGNLIFMKYKYKNR